MRAALARHDALAASVIADTRRRCWSGHAARATACSASSTAPPTPSRRRWPCSARLSAEPWPPETPLRVRMALHTGRGRPARRRLLRRGRQPLRAAAVRWRTAGRCCSRRPSTTWCATICPPASSLRDLGEHRLRDLARPERVFQLLHPDLPAEFPPLRSLDALPNNLPHPDHQFRRARAGKRRGQGAAGRPRAC